MRQSTIWSWWSCAVLGGVMPMTAQAQTHAVKKPETVVRAIAVYEWTGDAAKPTASRVIPVSIYIDGHLEDGGLYLARPVPFELNTGTIFEVQKAGVPEGTLDLSYTRHYVSNGTPAFDDGWLGYGPFKPAPKPVLVASKKSGPLPQVVTSGGSGPHFSNGGAAASGTSTTPVDRSDAAGAGTTVSADKDPDAPTMRKRTTDPGSASTDSDSSKDVDRPTLKRRTPEEQKAAQKKKDLASVTGSASLNDDPDRPNLHRGKPASRLDEEDIPPLKGMPPDLRQEVAVSDAKDRPEHPFERMWESDDERAQVTASLEEMSRAQLAKYDLPATPGTPSLVPTRSPAPSTAATSAAARARQRKAAATAAVPVTLKDESVKAYTLSYGGAATYVYTATSPGVGGIDRFVSVVAQREPQGSLKLALANVTDAKHLDRTPWMRLVDAVDAEASNRASLLFELRAQSSRQFALYRVIGAAVEQTFVTAVPE